MNSFAKLASAQGLLTGLAFVGAMAVAACGGKKTETPPTTAPAEVAPAPDAAAAPADAAATPTPTPGADELAASCKSFADRLCTEAGDPSETCTAVRTVTGLLPVAACDAALKEVEYSVGKIKNLRKSCEELVAKLCADLGDTTETCAMVKRETPKFPTERCVQFLGQYDQVLGDLKRMEAKNKPLEAEKIAKIAGPDAAAFGPADAKVTVVEFSDFQCPYCSQAANAVTQIKEKYSDKVRFVFRHFPLSFHQDAHLASQATLAANKQGKFFEYHDLLFKNQKALKREDLEKYATELGLDLAAFKADLDGGAFKAAVDADMKLGEEVAVDGTPTMFVNGKRVANPTDFGAISAMIETELGGGAPAPAPAPAPVPAPTQP